MKKFVFWCTRHNNSNIVLTENLEKYAQGKTAWQALQHLCETLQQFVPAASIDESDFNKRLKMFHETGINKIEIFIEKENSKYSVHSAGVRSFIESDDEQSALVKFAEMMALNSLENERGQMGV